MIATGIVRRIDDLGRIVIDKEVRYRVFGTVDTEGKPMEIFYEEDGTIILKPYKVGEEVQTMNTNFQMLRELLEKYHPKQRGFISAEETKLIKETLHIEEMNILALRNLRDFTVMFLSKEAKEKETMDNIMENWDRMSAITYVIDTEISQKGGEV